jgi:hypothetical protein
MIKKTVKDDEERGGMQADPGPHVSRPQPPSGSRR